MLITLTFDGNGDALTCTDEAHVVHDDGKVHSGLFLTIGKGAMMNASKNLGVVKTSSTET